MLSFIAKKILTVVIILAIIILLCFMLNYTHQTDNQLGLFHELAHYCSTILSNPLDLNHTYILPDETLKSVLLPSAMRFFIVIILSILIGFPAGIYFGLLNKPILNNGIKVICVIFYSCPIVLLSLLLNNLFHSIDIELLNQPFVLERYTEHHTFSAKIEFNVPIFILVVLPCIITIQTVSKNVESVIRQNFIKISLIKNPSKFNVIMKHVLPNVIPTSMNQLLYHSSNLLFSVMMVEILFNIHGLGLFSYAAFINSNYSAISSMIVMTSFFLSFFWLIGQCLIAILYPFTLKTNASY